MTSGRSESGPDCADWMGSALVQFLASARRSANELSRRVSAGWAPTQLATSQEAERLLELSLSGDVSKLRERLSSSWLNSASALDDAIGLIEMKWRYREIGFEECLRAVFCLEKAISDVVIMATRNENSVVHPMGAGLVALLPGEAHSLGAKVVTQKLGLEGWSAQLLVDTAPGTLQDRVRGEFYHFVGISVGRDEALLGLPDTIAELRDISRNRDLTILAGGNIFDMPQECYAFLGADLIAASADAAVRYLRSDLRAPSAHHN